MGTVEDSYYNAIAETFFASLDGELIERSSVQSKSQPRMVGFTWIEGSYEPRCRRRVLGYLSPMNFERSHEIMFDVAEAATAPFESMPAMA